MVIGITMNAECFDYQSNNSIMQTGTPGYRHTSMQANSRTQKKNEKCANTQTSRNTIQIYSNTTIEASKQPATQDKIIQA
jgi:hypothetical protein